MKLIKILPIIFFAFVLSCDKVDIPVKDKGNTCGDDNLSPIRKILVEDYTGHKCNNCPSAAEILHEISKNYCKHIIPVAVHVSGFAAPTAGHFENDYRTDAGNELDAFFQVSNQGLPNGLVNRKPYDNKIVVNKNNWETAVNLLFDIPPDVNITIESIYNEETKEITAKLTAEFLFGINSEINIGLYVTEDSIVSPQLTPTGIEENYLHMHMLRKAVTGTFGDNLVISATEGDKIEKTYNFTADEKWNINHCNLVAFISNRETKEIIQAESEHITQ